MIKTTVFVLLSLFVVTPSFAQMAGSELCVLARPSGMKMGGHATLYYRGTNQSLFQTLMLETGPPKDFEPFTEGASARARLQAFNSPGGVVGFCYRLNVSEEATFNGMVFSREWLTSWMSQELVNWKMIQNNCADFTYRVFLTVTGIALDVTENGGGLATPEGLAKHVSAGEYGFQSDGRAVTFLNSNDVAAYLLQ